MLICLTITLLTGCSSMNAVSLSDERNKVIQEQKEAEKKSKDTAKDNTTDSEKDTAKTKKKSKNSKKKKNKKNESESKNEVTDDGDTAQEHIDKNKEENPSRAETTKNKLYADADAEYNEIMERYANTDSASDDDRSIAEILLSTYYDFYEKIRIWAAPISFVSMIIGIFLAIFAKGNKAVRRFGIFGLAIGIPTLMVFLVFGVGILNDIFLN